MPDQPTDRRGFLRQNIFAIGRLLADTMSNSVTKAAGGKRYHRPPGAIDEAAFLLSCTRCGDCVKACPTQVIKLLPTNAGIAAGTPYIDPSQSPCNLCGECMPACAPAALLNIADPRQVRMGTAVINPDACWAHQGSLCDMCYHHCPYPDEAIKIVNGRPVIVADACTGCGQCLYACPATPLAIRIDPTN